MPIVDGPIIQFSFSAADVADAVRPALAEARRQSQSVSNSIAQDWQRMAAQIRAGLAQETAGTKEVTAERTRLIGVLDRQISGYRQLAELSKSELSNLKAMTLERERQSNALKTGTVGVTAGTNAALGQVSQQTILGIGRILDSLVNRYLGGAAGAAVRTGRDLYYYNSLAKGSGGDSGAAGGSDGGILSGIGAITSAIPEGVLAVGGFTAALAGLAAAGFSVTKSLADTAQAINTTSASTGLSTTQVQVYGRLASNAGVDPESLTNAVGRLQVQLGEYVEKGKTADESTEAFIRTLNQFGISVTDSSGHLRSVNDDISDFGTILQALPDKNKAVALSMEAFGVRGKAIVDVLNEATLRGESFSEAIGKIQARGDFIAPGQIQNLQKAKNAWDELWEAVQGKALSAKEGIAEEFLRRTGLQTLLNNTPEGAQTAQQKAIAEVLKSSKAPVGGTSFFVGDPAQTKSQVEALLKGNDQAAKIEELRKQATEELAHGNYMVALSLAQQVNSLTKAVALEKQRAEMQERVAEAIFRPRAANVQPGREARSLADLYSTYSNGPSSAPGINDPNLGLGGSTNVLAGIIGPAAKTPLDAAALLQQINKEHEDLFKSQAQIDAEHYQDELTSLNDALKQQLISQQEYNDAVVKMTADRNKTLNDANKKFEDEAGSLFDDLISGNGQGFAKGLLKNVENIALGPVKQVFEQIVGSQLNALAQLFSGKPVTPGTAPAAGSGSGLGGIFGGLGGILGKIGIGGTPGWWPGAVGNGPGGGVGQPTLSTNVMDVRAQVVNIASLGIANSSGGLGGGLGLPGASGFLGGTGGFGSFFGNLNPFGQSGGAGGPVGGIGGALGTLQNVFSKLSPYAAGAATLGIGIATGNESAMAMGAATLASKAATALSGLSGLPAGLSSALGTAGSALPGIGIGASGVISAYQSKGAAGKIGGTLEAGAGGALAGLMVGGPIGAAIGGAIGLIGGTVASILGGNAQGFQQGVTHAMAYHQYHAPTSENFSFASNGSIANTLGTGFFQSGNQFQQYGLAAGTPFWANALTGHLSWQNQYRLNNSGLDPNAPFLGDPTFNPYVGQGPVGSKAGSSPNVNITLAIPGLVDSNNFAQTIAPHLDYLTRAISNRVSASSSGFGSNTRRAVFLP